MIIWQNPVRLLELLTMKNIIFPLISAAVVFIAGCGENVGYVIKPIPMEERLVERIVATEPGWFVTDRIAVIDVDGLLFNQRMGWFGFEDNPVSLFTEKMDAVSADPRVKAVVLRINSPGGGVNASDLMYRRLMSMKESRNIPVVAVIQDVGASGGYFLACGADEIIANPASITGSIGVIVQTFSFAGTMQKLGIDARSVTSGPRKDMSSPLKPIDADDIAVLQGIVDEFHSRFVDVVAEGRPGLDRPDIERLADGRVWTGDQARELGFVDHVGYLEEGISLAKQLSGATVVKVVMYSRPWGYRSSVYASSDAPVADASGNVNFNLVNLNMPDMFGLTQPAFLYLWTGK